MEEMRAAASKAALRASEEMSQLTTKVALQVFVFVTLEVFFLNLATGVESL